MEVPDEALIYSTDARTENAAEGGTPELAADVMAALAKRGDKAVADGALTATARWLLREALQERQVGPASADAASRHFGFGGVVTSLAAFDSGQPEVWREALARIPKNVQINRFGVCASQTKQAFAVIFGTVTLDFEPIARFVDPGTTIRLRGEVDRRYTSAQVFLTKPDGTVEEHKMASRKLEYSAALTTPGKYKLEVMGEGSMGPVVISNIPVFVGVKEPPLTELVRKSSSPAEAEGRMLELLNQTRTANRLRPVESDGELRAIALAHSKDMADHDFVAHVSPTTGTPEDRLGRAKLLVGECAENIAAAPTPESAHDELMESPAHRSAMLGATYTHVGIGAVEHHDSVIATLLFCRRPDPTKLPRDAAQIEAALFALRAAKKLPRPAVDPIYRTAAQRGVEAYLRSSKPTVDVASTATIDAIRTEIGRLRTARPAAKVCTFFLDLTEVEQLERTAPLLAPGLAKFGVGAQLHTDDKGARLATVMVLEGACQ
ncbi:MAG TPA: CAP domain-containing protein [Polyangiaceae bacterium]|nr:CAP domain-containing protein [Polyangiaceae bacterium]